MYSMVLMVAMSTAPDAPAFGKKYSYGCSGSSCTGYVVTAPVYSGCSGCTGCTGYHSKGLFGMKHGCCGGMSCMGSSCCGTTMMFGMKHGCCGGMSCMGSCTGMGFCGKMKKHGCSGSSCYGSGCFGSGMGCVGTPVMTTPMMPTTPPPMAPTPVVPKKVGMMDQPASIALTVPADAKVSIDGVATTSVSTTRVFATPALEAGKVFYYNIQAEVVRDGKVFSSSERVAVKAGETTSIAIDPQVNSSVASK